MDPENLKLQSKMPTSPWASMPSVLPCCNLGSLTEDLKSLLAVHSLARTSLLNMATCPCATSNMMRSSQDLPSGCCTQAARPCWAHHMTGKSILRRFPRVQSDLFHRSFINFDSIFTSFRAHGSNRLAFKRDPFSPRLVARLSPPSLRPSALAPSAPALGAPATSARRRAQRLQSGGSRSCYTAPEA